MAIKSSDVQLRITAKNAAGKTLDELNKSVDRLAEGQKEYASAAGLSRRAMADLTGEARELSAVTRELSRRENLTRGFIEQRKEIGATAGKLRELSAVYREMQRGSGGSLIGFSDADVRRTGKEIEATKRQLDKLVAANDRAGASLRALGVNTDAVEGELATLSGAVKKSEAAYEASAAAVRNYADAQREVAATSDAAAKAAARAAAAARLQSGVAGAQGSRNAAASDALRAAMREADARKEAAAATATQAAEQAKLAQVQRTEAGRLAAITEAVGRRNAAELTRVQTLRAGEAAQRRQTAAEASAAASGERRRNLLVATNAAEAASLARKERLAALLTRLSGETDKNTAANNRNATAVRRSGDSLALFSDVGRKSLGTYQRLRGQVLAIGASFIGVYQAINTFNQAMQATQRMQALRVGLNAANNGDTVAAAADMAFLRKEAERLGLVFDDLAPKFANILVGARSAGFSRGQTKTMFSDLQLIAASLNLSAEAADRMNYAVTQIFSKGRVQAEELNQQLGDVLPAAVVKFQESMGLADGELQKLMKEGKVTVADFARFVETYADQFRGQEEQISQRLSAQVNRAKNAYNDFLRTLLEGDVEKSLGQAFGRIATFFRSSDGARFGESLQKILAGLIDGFIYLADNIEIVTTLVKVFVGLQLAKFLNDSIIGVRNLAVGMKGLATAALASNAATGAAAVSTATLAGKVRLLYVALAPIAGVLAVVTAGVFNYIRGINEATARTEDYAKALEGLTFARTEEEFESGFAGARNEIDDLGKEITQLQSDKRELDKAFSTRPVTYLAETGERLTAENVDKRLEESMRRRDELQKSLVNGAIRYNEVVDERMKRDAIESKRSPAASDGGGGSGGMTDRAAAREANAQVNARRAIQKEMLDLDQAIFSAQIEGNARTKEQIDKNYQLTIDQIASETEERLLAIDKLEQAAIEASKTYDKKGNLTGGGTLSAEDAADLAIVRARVLELQTERNVRAFMVSDMQGLKVEEQKINDLISERDSKIAAVNELREAGAISEGEAYGRVIALQDQYNDRIRVLIEELLPILQAIDPQSNLYHALGVPELIAGLEQAQAGMVKLTAAQRVGLSIGKMFAGGMADSLVTFGRAIVGIEGGFKAAMDAFRNFAADFLQRIAQMILEAIILQAIQNAINNRSGGYTQAVVNAFTQHTGGIAGSSGLARRRVDPSVFIDAPRFHAGGLPGLRSNEVATILEKGEEVLPATDPRHVANGGAGGGEGVTQVIATFDPAEVVIAAMKDTRVRKRLIATFGSNKNQLNQATRSN